MSEPSGGQPVPGNQPGGSSGGWPPPAGPPEWQPPYQPYQQPPYPPGHRQQAPYQQAMYQQGQQPGWGQPAWGPPPVPPKRSSTGLVIGIVAGVLALVLVVAGGVLVLRSRLDGMSSSASAPSAITVPTWTNSAPSSGASSGSTDSSDFLAMLPEDFTDCAADELAGNGDTAAATCGAVSSSRGPAAAIFYQYPDADTLEDAFEDLVSGDDLIVGGFPGVVSKDDPCTAEGGWGTWGDDSTDESLGDVGCGVTSRNRAVLLWSDEQSGILGELFMAHGDQDDLDDLVDWWGDHGYYQD